MKLYLGEGAAEYIDFIEAAAELWNAALRSSGQEMIEVVKDVRPVNWAIDDQFWLNPGSYTGSVESGSDARTLAKGSSCFGVVPTAFAICRCLTDPRA